MKRLFLAAGMLTVLASFNMTAQLPGHPVARGNVPFDFQISNVTIPAGTVVISRSPNMLTIYSVKGKRAAMVLTTPANHRNTPLTDSVLQFKVYGNEYFLTKFWSADTQDGVSVPVTKREKELARRMPISHTDDVALNTNNRPAQDGR
jgi:hypothetical protein